MYPLSVLFEVCIFCGNCMPAAVQRTAWPGSNSHSMQRICAYTSDVAAATGDVLQAHPEPDAGADGLLEGRSRDGTCAVVPLGGWYLDLGARAFVSDVTIWPCLTGRGDLRGLEVRPSTRTV